MTPAEVPEFDEVVENETETETEVEVEATSESEGSEEFRAWDLPKPEPKIPAHIPYDRFRQVNEERQQIFEDNKALAARVKELEEAQEKLSQVPDPDDIKIEDFDNPQDYLRARDKAVAARIRADIDADNAAREQKQLVEQQMNEIGQRYATNLADQIAENPNIARAQEFFDTYADRVNPLVGRELISDPNVGHVMLKLATDKELLTKFFQAQSNPIDAVRLINRVSARIDAERAISPAQRRSDVPEPLSVQPKADPKAQVRAALPVQVKGSGVSNRLDLYKDADKMSLAQWRKLRSGKS